MQHYFSYNDGRMSGEKMENPTFSAEIGFRQSQKNVTIFKKNDKLILCGMKSDHVYDRISSISSNIYALCKSNLQKCVRRGETERACRTALAMLLLKPADFLRRLPIIMVEDALIHPDSFVFLVWLMCASSKGYQLSKKEVDRIMGIVAGMCESKQYEKFRSEIEPEKVEYVLDCEKELFLFSMEIRKEYGGMWCDKEMLRKHQLIWRKRFHETDASKIDYWALLSEQKYEDLDADKIGDFLRTDILPVSIDYHVFPWLLNDFDKQAKLAIWLFVSGKNYKTPFVPLREVSKEIEELYEKIKKTYTQRVLTLYRKLIN